MPRNTPAKPTAPAVAAERSRREVEAKELQKRIERLEERIDGSILGDDGLATLDPGLDAGIDKSSAGDALQKAVQRSNVRRNSRKA